MALVIQTCLEDYTNDQRGDVGSLLRLQAIDAVRAAWQSGALEPREENAPRLISAVCVLAAEKLDKIRYRAWTCLSELFETFYPPLRELHGCSDSLTPKFVNLISPPKSRANIVRQVRRCRSGFEPRLLPASSFVLLDRIAPDSAPPRSSHLRRCRLRICASCLARRTIVVLGSSGEGHPPRRLPLPRESPSRESDQRKTRRAYSRKHCFCSRY